VCLDMLRSRRSRREEPLEAGPAEPPAPAEGIDPEREAVLADAVGPALMVVLDALGPAERLAFVLHDLFAVPFDEIAEVLGRSPAATRQLASRARRRIQGAEPVPAADLARRRTVVDAFLAASREGDFAGLLDLLAPDAELRGAPEWIRPGPDEVVRGADAVARVFSGSAKAALPATVDGEPCLVWMHRGEIRSVFAFAIEDGRIVGVDLIMDPAELADLDVQLVRGASGAARRAARD
jgi:hypothetical protein